MRATSLRATSFVDGRLIGPPLDVLVPASPELPLLELLLVDDVALPEEDEAPPSGGCT
jgi:hypothetical protein